MNSNGLVVAIEDPNHSEVFSYMSFNDVTSSKYVSVDRVNQSKFWDKSLSYSGPAKVEDYKFSGLAQPLQNTFMMIIVSGRPGDLFEYEIWQHTEFLGNPVSGKTRSHADPQTFGKVMETIKGATSDRPIEPFMAPSLWQRFKQSVSDSLPSLASGAYAVVESALKLDPSKLIEGYRGIERGMAQLSLDYGNQVTKKALPPPSSSRHFPDIPIVRPTYVEVVDDVNEAFASPLTLRSRAIRSKRAVSVRNTREKDGTKASTDMLTEAVERRVQGESVSRVTINSAVAAGKLPVGEHCSNCSPPS